MHSAVAFSGCDGYLEARVGQQGNRPITASLACHDTLSVSLAGHVD